MALSLGAQRARENEYGSLKAFREYSESRDYRIMAGRYTAATGTSFKANLRPTSKFARLWGKSFLKDGKKRAHSNKTYAKLLQQKTYLRSVPDQADETDY